MDWFAFVFTMTGANQLRSIFEEGVLAHQPIDGGLAKGIQIFSGVSSFCMAQLFLRLEDVLRTTIASPSASKLRSSGIPILAQAVLLLFRSGLEFVQE
jgi:hypothetical protein